MLHSIRERGIALKKKGKKGNGLRRLFAGADESARNAPKRERSEVPSDYEPDQDETLEDIIAKYGKYLDEDGVPFRGINPNPKYYVVPKEPPKPVSKKATVRKVKKARPEPVPVAVPEPLPKKVTVRKVRKAKPEPEPVAVSEPAPKKVTVKKRKKATRVTVKKKSKAKP